MNDAAWSISALLTVAFLIAAGASSGALAFGWLLLSFGMGAVTVVRFKARGRSR